MEDNNRDGVVDYINAKIYVSDNPTSYEIAAASNIAARFAFESLSIDLPIGHKISDFNSNDSSLAIIIGNAANNYFGENYLNIVEKKVGNRKIVAIKNIAIAESWAQSLFKNDKESKEVDNEKDSGKDEDGTPTPLWQCMREVLSLSAHYSDTNTDLMPEKKPVVRPADLRPGSTRGRDLRPWRFRFRPGREGPAQSNSSGRRLARV